MNMPSEKLQNRRVLVVEDHDVNRLVACFELERIGFAVDSVTNGEEACARVKENEYALVFMDCQMPVMDGLTATRNIRESGNLVPIIAMTGSSAESDHERCLDAGMNDSVSKPFEPDDLQRILTRWLASGDDEPAIESVCK